MFVISFKDGKWRLIACISLEDMFDTIEIMQMANYSHICVSNQDNWINALLDLSSLNLKV